ncbi:MAG: hypothetical protein ACLP9L_40400 [Thermoguttaceae bacterium]
MTEYPSFSAFQNAMKQWLKDNPSAAQLDGNHVRQKNPVTTHEVRLGDIAGLTQVVIAFHRDTWREALEKVVQGKIEDFILLGPGEHGKKWRFHYAKTHDLTNLNSADGMFTHVKE